MSLASQGESSGGSVPPGSTDGKESMIGQRVTGFVEATFDAGYVLSLRIGESESNLRGLVFKPGSFVPITEANDVAPRLPMMQRSEAVSVPSKRKYTSRKQICSVSPNNVAPSVTPGDPTATQSGNRGETDVSVAVGLDHSAPKSPNATTTTEQAVDIHLFESVKMLDEVAQESAVFSAQETGNAREEAFDSLEQHDNALTTPS